MIDIYKINSNVLNSLVYDDTYRSIHRVRYSTVVRSDYGPIGVMLSRRYNQITIHWYYEEVGIYFKFPEYAKNETEVNSLLRGLVKNVNIGNRILNDLRETSISLGILYLTLDKIAVECQINAKKLKIVMKLLLDKNIYTRLDVIFYFALFLREYKVSKEMEPILSRLDGYMRNFPSVHSYEPQLNLANYTFSKATQARVPRISYEDFLETIEGFTDDEVLEMVGNYKILNPYEEKQDIREILYRVTQRFK